MFPTMIDDTNDALLVMCCIILLLKIYPAISLYQLSDYQYDYVNL